jgi:protein phosphatase
VAQAQAGQRTVPSQTVPVDVPDDRPTRAGRAGLRRGPPRRRRRGKSLLTLALALVMLGAILVGAKALIDSRYFVGTNDAGLVTLYNGVPYDLPLGIALYDEQYVSPVPARTLPARQRTRILDHQLRSKGDATDLVRQIERGRLDN